MQALSLRESLSGFRVDPRVVRSLAEKGLVERIEHNLRYTVWRLRPLWRIYRLITKGRKTRVRLYGR